MVRPEVALDGGVKETVPGQDEVEIRPAAAGITGGGVENQRLVLRGAEHMLGLAVEVAADALDLHFGSIALCGIKRVGEREQPPILAQVCIPLRSRCGLDDGKRLLAERQGAKHVFERLGQARDPVEGLGKRAVPAAHDDGPAQDLRGEWGQSTRINTLCESESIKWGQA